MIKVLNSETREDFFTKKANSYIQEIDSLSGIFISFPFNHDISQLNKYKEQEELISEIKLRVKLLFSEYVHGDILKGRLDEIDQQNNLLFDGEHERIKQYKRILEMFVDHIKEYR
jgi:glucan phosphorylase